MKKTRYRIKIVTYANGRTGYFPMRWCYFRWRGISWDGDLNDFYFPEYNSRSMALERIDRNYGGNLRKASIHFEYIDK